MALAQVSKKPVPDRNASLVDCMRIQYHKINFSIYMAAFLSQDAPVKAVCIELYNHSPNVSLLL